VSSTLSDDGKKGRGRVVLNPFFVSAPASA
jgi:hypothetical protein